MNLYYKIYSKCFENKFITFLVSLIGSFSKLSLLLMPTLIINAKSFIDFKFIFIAFFIAIFGELLNLIHLHRVENFAELKSNFFKIEFFSAIKNIDLKTFEDYDLKKRLYSAQNFIENHVKISKDFYNTLINLIVILIFYILLFFINTLIFCIYVLIFFIILYIKKLQLKSSKNIWKKYMENSKEHNEINNILIDKQHSNERKIFNVFNFYKKVFKEKYDFSIYENRKDGRKRLIFDFLYEFVNYLIFIIMFILTLNLYYNEKINLGYLYFINGGLVLFVNLLGTEFNKFSDYFNFSQNLLIFEELLEIKKDENDNIFLNNYDIEFKNVSFKYPNSNKYAIRNFTFNFKEGKNYSILGKNGSGKSTLIKLLLGLYDVESGSIKIGGVDISKISIHDRANIFSVLFQHSNKYPFTIYENIALDNTNEIYIDEDLTKDISKFNLGISSPTSSNYDNNVNLSGGQWKKIFFSRVFSRKAKICIFDEPTSNLDPFSELKYYNRIQQKLSGALNIFISHRLGIVKYTDLILILEDGKLIENGTHEELISNGGRYFEMYEMQKSIFE